MKKVDLFWKSNHDWWEFKDGIPALKESVPQEAMESYEHYLEQMSEERICKIDCDWQEEFAPHILARGKKYFEEGRVSKIIQYGNRIVAHVDGTEDYCVEIELPGGMPDSWLCTCPYAVQGNCKHKAALLFAIEAGEYTFTGDPPEFEEDILTGHTALPWYDAIERLPANTIREILLYFADQDTTIREHLAISYLHGLPDGLIAQWIDNLQSYAREMSSGYRYIPENDLRHFMNGVRSALNERFPLLRKVGAIMDAFYYLGAVFEVASKWVYSDDDGYFDDFRIDCSDLWELLFSEATEAQREQMHTWFWEHRRAFFAHANHEYDIPFLNLSWSNVLERKSLEIIDELIYKRQKHDDLALLIDCRIEIMDFLEYSQEDKWDFLKKHLDLDYARHWLLMDYEEYPENHVFIVPLLKQLKEMDINDLPRLIEDSVRLIQFSKKESILDMYEAERNLVLTRYMHVLEDKVPGVLDKASAREFIDCLKTLRYLKDVEVDQMISELVDKICSNPAIARKGIVELFNRSGFEWPKSYRFLG